MRFDPKDRNAIADTLNVPVAGCVGEMRRMRQADKVCS